MANSVPWIIVVAVYLWNVGVAQNLITQPTVAWIPESIRYSSRGIDASCRTIIPHPKTGHAIDLPPERMEIYVGAVDGEYVYTLSFGTARVDQTACSDSALIVAKHRNMSAYNDDETRKARERYKIKDSCVYDAPEVRGPSRTVTVSVYPITDKDLVTWECSAFWGHRKLSAPILRHDTVIPRWFHSLPPERRYPRVHVIPRNGSELMKIGCVIPGADLKALKPTLSDENLLPQLEVKLIRKLGDRVDGVIYRDVYGRFSRTTDKANVMGVPQYQCTHDQYHGKVTHCLADDPRDSVQPVGIDNFEECDDLVIVAAFSGAVQKTYVQNIPAYNVLDVLSLMQPFASEFITPIKDPRIEQDFNKRHIVIQLPSDAAIVPLWMYSGLAPRFVELGPSPSYYVTRVMPNSEIVSSFYANVIAGLIQRPILKGLHVELLEVDGSQLAQMTCGPNGGRIIFIASSVCIANGGTPVPVLGKQSTTSRSAWCGQRGGHYAVHVVDVKNDEPVMVVKQTYKQEHGYIYREFTCMWGQYYCLTGSRTTPVESVTLLEPFPDQAPHTDTRPSRNPANMAEDFISPDMCPVCEDKFNVSRCKLAKDNMLPVFQHRNIDRNEIRRWVKYAIQDMPELRNFRVDEEAYISQLALGCSCRQKLNLCNNDRVDGLFGYAILDRHHITDSDEQFIICDALGRQSPARSYRDLVAEYVCDGYSSPHDNVIDLLPKPSVMIKPEPEVLSDGHQYISLSCLNVNKRCLYNIPKQYKQSEIQLLLQKGTGTHNNVFNFATVRYFPRQNKTLWLKVERERTHMSAKISQHNVTNNLSSLDIPVILVDNPVTDYYQDEPFEILIRKSALEYHDTVECSYTGRWNHIGDRENISSRLCSKEDYEVIHTKMTSVGTTLVCEVHYSSAVRSKGCGKPYLLLESDLYDYDAILNDHVLCNGYTGGNVLLGSLDGDVPRRFYKNPENFGRGYCVYDTNRQKITAVRLLGNLNTSDWGFRCDAMQNRVEINSTSTVLLADVAEVPCVSPPSVFTPVVTVISDASTKQDTTVACSLPHWLREPCHENAFRVSDVVMYADVSSNVRAITRQTIATLDTAGTCHSHKDHVCMTTRTTSFQDNRMLFVVHFQKRMFYEIVYEVGAMVKITCAMHDSQSTALVYGLPPITSSPSTPQSSQKVTIGLPKKILTEKIYIIIMTVVPLFLVLIIGVIVIVITAVVKASRSTNALESIRRRAGRIV